MTEQEFNTFTTRLFVTFPDVLEWLRGFDFYRETLATWRETLKPFRLDECLLIIDSWVTRKRPMFKAYERSQLAILIANCVEFDRAKERKVNGSDRSRFEFTERSRDDVLRARRGYTPVDAGLPSLAKALREGRALGESLRKGEITEGEYYRRKQEILNDL